VPGVSRVRFRPELLAVAESPMVRIATEAEAMPGSIKLCYGESDMPTPAFICAAASEALDAGHTFYTHTAGYPELREAIAQKIGELHGISYRPTEIMATVGGTMAVYIAIRAFVGAGDNAIVISPAYAIFSNAIAMAGGEPRAVPLARDGDRFTLDLDRISASIDNATRMIVVNSPSNPTGWVISSADQHALAELADRHNLMILSDEVYERLTFGTSIASSFATVIADKSRLVVVNSFSKTYNMTGWRLGWAQASEAAIHVMYRAAEFITSNPAAMAQRAGIAALRDGEAYVAWLRGYYSARRAQVTAELRALPGVSLLEPDGAFYAFMRIDGLGDSTTFAARLLRETGVALAPGVGFGAAGEGHMRMCFAATEQTVAEALSRISQFIRKGR
jgi:aspartate/methionine/tyrosine aminotransferase